MTNQSITTASTFYLPAVELPTARIATNRNNEKQYGNIVYLNDKQEFQIEVFNPKTTPVLAKIYLNEKLISTTGLVILPGQRIWLERFIDSNNKFVFETYEVGNSPAIQKAIENNGKLRVEFYDEKVINFFQVYQPSIFWTNTNYIDYNNDISYRCTNLSSNTLSDEQMSVNCCSKSSDSIETGRINKGQESNQNFNSFNGEFESYYFHSIYLQIKPFSQKPFYQKDIKIKCKRCGKKSKERNAKFCTKCGFEL